MKINFDVSTRTVVGVTAVLLILTVLVLYFYAGLPALLVLSVAFLNGFGSLVFLIRPRLIEKSLGLALFVATLLVACRMLLLVPPR